MTNEYFLFDKRSMKLRNQCKYFGIPPNWKIVQDVIFNKSGIKSVYRFQRIFNVPGRVLSQYKAGDRLLPAQYWHIFYEFDEILEAYKPQPNYHNAGASKPVEIPIPKISEKNKKRLNDYREALAKSQQ